MKKLFQEFKDFALRGSVMDLAVGVIIGAAFQGVVKSLTDNILSPIIGLFAGKNFDALELVVFNEVTIKYGAFITSIINFVITALVIFLLVKGMSKLAKLGKKKQEELAAPTKICPYCLSEVALLATRCAHCTAELRAESAKK